MAGDFLLEIGTEEMPTSAVYAGVEQLKENAQRVFEDARLSYNKLDTMGTPRRLVIIVSDLAQKQKEVLHEVRGPARKAAYTDQGEPTAAAIGFAKAQGVRIGDLVVKKVPQGEYVFAVKKEAGELTAKLLPELLPRLILSLSFPKSMRWEDEIKFPRPIRWLMALYGKETVSFRLGSLESSNLTWGHRFLASNPIRVNGARDYFKAMEAGKVIVDHREREEVIRKLIGKTAREVDGKAVIDAQTLAEVVNLVEFPHVVCGTFSAEFVDLPKDVLVTVMESHQRYFPVEDAVGNLISHFIVIHNGDEKHNTVITRGHESVLRARLADAKFFFEEDLKEPLIKKVEKLKGVVFQEKLGTMYDKVVRIRGLAREIARELELDAKTIADAKRAASLSKADLVTEMVVEFPALQGIMGREYARLSGESEAVALGIYEHYLPRSATDLPPRTVIGRILSIADKMDNIVGCFSLGLIPSGSQDPYALRRQIQGIIGIILENKLPLSVRKLTDLSVVMYKRASLEPCPPREVKKELNDFFKTRLRAQFLNEGFAYDIIDAVLVSEVDDIVDLKARIVSLSEKRESKEMDDLLTAFTRCKNLSQPSLGRRVRGSLLREEWEKRLYAAVVEAERDIAGYLEKAHPAVGGVDGADYKGAIKVLADLRPTVDRFFDEVLVMAEERDVRRNRLSLLNRCVELFLKVADFSKLVILEGNRE